MCLSLSSDPDGASSTGLVMWAIDHWREVVCLRSWMWRYLFGVELEGGAKDLVPVEAVPSTVHKTTSRTVLKRQNVEYQDRDIFWQAIGEIHRISAPVVTFISLFRHSTTFPKDNIVHRAVPRQRSTKNGLLPVFDCR